MLLEPATRSVLEEPHYFGDARGAADPRRAGAHGRRRPHGLRCDDLPRPAPKLICVTPSHQFPSGAVLSLTRRLALLDYARRRECWILEDDYDGEFRYDARPMAALRSLDESGRVIYVGTLLQGDVPVAAAGLHGGAAGAARRLRQRQVAGRLRLARRSSRRRWRSFIGDGGFERHLRRSRKTLKRAPRGAARRRCAALAATGSRSTTRAPACTWWCGCAATNAAQGEAFIARARSLGLGLYPIAPYYLDAARPRRAAVRLRGDAGGRDPRRRWRCSRLPGRVTG